MLSGLTVALLACLSAGQSWQQFRVAGGKPASRGQIVLGATPMIQRTSGALLLGVAVMLLALGFGR